jgi:hypothetical protein
MGEKTYIIWGVEDSVTEKYGAKRFRLLYRSFFWHAKMKCRIIIIVCGMNTSGPFEMYDKEIRTVDH